MEQIQHFTSIIPCQVSENSSNLPFSCTLVLDFTKSSVQFNLFKIDSKDTAPIQFQYKKYNKLLISTSRCIFINANEDISTTFFFFCSISDGYTNNNLRRFVFALADAGMLIPESDEAFSEIQNNYCPFQFIPDPSFMPDGFYNFTNHLIHRNVRKICITRIRSIKNKKDFPLNPRYLNLVFPYLHKAENDKIILSKDKSANNFSLNFVMHHHLKILNKILTKFYDQKMYNQFKREIIKVEKNSKYSEYFRMIESDCQEFNSEISDVYNQRPNQIISPFYKDKWNTKISNICVNVCKVYVISQNAEYYENNFIVAMNIALLLKNGLKLDDLSEFSNDGPNKKDVETFSKGINTLISKKSPEEYEAMIFSIYSVLMNGLTKKVLTNYGYNFCMKTMNYISPTSHAFFILKNIESFKWLEKDIKELFLLTFKCPWIVWFFIMRASNSEMAIESVIAAVVYHLVPQLVNQNIDDEKSIERFWPNFVRGLQNDVDLVKSIIDIASYFHKYHGSFEPK